MLQLVNPLFISLESVSRDARDNVGIMDRLLEYDHKKINCLILLDGKKVETANSLQHVQNGKRKIDGVHTKLQCLKRFQSNLGTLTKDFEKTTNQKDGGQLLQRMCSNLKY